MNNLPSGWAPITLGEISSEVKNGISIKPTEAQGLPILRISSVRPGRLDVSDVRFLSSEITGLDAYKLRPDDLLFTRYNGNRDFVGVCARVPLLNRDCYYPDKLIRVRVNRSFVLPGYVEKISISPQFRKLVDRKLKTSAGQVGISGADLKELPIPIPPLAEQTRIADKLDAVLSRVDAVNARLARVAPLLKRFRQSVLAAATSGRLTEDWRITTDLPASCARTQVNHLRKISQGRLRIRGEAVRVSEDRLFLLPQSWSWVQNHELAKDLENSICAGPFGTIFKAKDFRRNGIPIIFLRHIGLGKFLTHKPEYMDEAVWKELHQPYSVAGGELLVTKLGDPPGTACLYPKDSGTAMVTPDVLKMDVDQRLAEPAYLMHFFNSHNSKQIIEDLCFGVTRLRIDIAMFKTFPVPLPPREEQTEIVRRVETLFAFADRLEARLKAAQTAAQRLTPAVLAKAFRGELVPQDPADEPAAELLKRLAAQRAQGDSGSGRKRGRPARA